MKRTLILSAMALTAATATIAPASASASAQHRWDYDGGRQGDRDYRLVGAGVPILYRELRDTNRGRAFVLRNFDDDGDGRVQPREAQAANRAFAQVAGPRRDRFDWDRLDNVRGGPVVVETTTWDRTAMRGYGFRQTSRGAQMNLQDDVLFKTDSDLLRPGAVDRLRPLANYLRAEPGVRVAIDGHTDSRGTDAHNQDLSERRAASVRSAFDQMGVTRARFSVAGHGEAQPVATNATPQGMRRNRRVEITLLSQHADRF